MEAATQLAELLVLMQQAVSLIKRDLFFFVLVVVSIVSRFKVRATLA